MLIRTFLACCVALISTSACCGQITTEFTQAVSTLWNEPGNWTNGIPGPDDTAVVDFDMFKTEGPLLTSDVTIAKLILSDDSTCGLVLKLNLNSLNVGDLEMRGCPQIAGLGELNITGFTTFEGNEAEIDCVVNNFGSFFPHDSFDVNQEFRNMPGGLICGGGPGSMFGFGGTVINMQDALFANVLNVFDLDIVNFGTVIASDWDVMGGLSTFQQDAPGRFLSEGAAMVDTVCINGGSLGTGTFWFNNLQIKNLDLETFVDFFRTGVAGLDDSVVNFNVPGDSMDFFLSFDIDLQSTFNISANAGFGAGSYRLVNVDSAVGSTNIDVQLGVVPPGFAYELMEETIGSVYSLSLVVSEPCATSIGDINGDGFIDALDIAPFIDAIIGAYLCEADINQDGVVDLLDVEPFVELLSGN